MATLVGLLDRDNDLHVSQLPANLASFAQKAGIRGAKGISQHIPNRHPDRKLEAINRATSKRLFARGFLRDPVFA